MDAHADQSLAGRTCHFVGFVMSRLIIYLLFNYFLRKLVEITRKLVEISLFSEQTCNFTTIHVFIFKFMKMLKKYCSEK